MSQEPDGVTAARWFELRDGSLEHQRSTEPASICSEPGCAIKRTFTDSARCSVSMWLPSRILMLASAAAWPVVLLLQGWSGMGLTANVLVKPQWRHPSSALRQQAGHSRGLTNKSSTARISRVN